MRQSLLLLMLVSALASCSSPPSDADLIATFQRHRAEFEQLRVMASEDSQIRVLRNEWLAPMTGPDEKVGEAHPSITDDRWAEYRKRFRALGLDGGLVREPSADGRMWFHSYGSGLVVSGQSKGYAYCAAPPTLLIEDLDHGAVRLKEWNYRHIEGNWYLFYYFS